MSSHDHQTLEVLQTSQVYDPDSIAIVGMACRFPGARNVDQFWRNLCDGVESITFFSDEELLEAGVHPEELENPNYVRARPIIEDADLFDAAFFNISPREAEVLDPQHRVFLECAWSVLESAGYDPETYPGRIGVYAGAELSSYLLNNLATNRGRLAVSGLQVVLGADRAYLSTRISYELNLKGPSITVQTSCSTSLVALHLACESLMNSECDLALAGGVTVSAPIKAGYYYQEGGILSPDGHCRAFDARSQGTLFGSGAGVVALKRIEDALADGDHIHAVVRGSAINNDGALKVGYTAPSVDGQAAAIAEALDVAGVSAETVTYVEAHGTATELGDPIEIAALTQAFRRSTQATGYCAIGSVKSNVGHLATAAGMAGLIKTCLALEHGLIPPSLYFEQPNPKIDFDDSPFYVNTTLRQWQGNGAPRRAGVSAFGMGGTNAHAVLEQPPQARSFDKLRRQSFDELTRPWQLLALSAKTDSALESATDQLAAHLQQHPELDLADVAYTLQLGRRAFEHRRVLACQNLEDAVSALQTRDPKRVLSGLQEISERPVAFMFPGLGDQYPNMALELYQVEPLFRAKVDRCCEFLKPLLGQDLRDILFPKEEQKPASAGFDLRSMMGRGEPQAAPSAQKLNQTSVAHPAVFVIEYALSQLLIEWGVRPQAVTGHSVGEYVAACVAGVLSLPDALTLVARRAQMIQELPGGAMLAVLLSEEAVQPFLSADLSLSAVNAPSLCVLGGPVEAIAALEKSLLEQGVAFQRVQTSHAFHSHMLNPIVEPLTNLVQTFKLNPPAIPYLSNLTGTWITPEQATDPGYWARHSRHPVRFADGVRELWQDPTRILLEVGPGHTLSTMSVQHPASGGALERVLSTIRHANERETDLAFLLNTLGQLWMAGVSVDWSAFYGEEQRRRVPLPTYPFERLRYWIEPGDSLDAGLAPASRQKDLGDWFYVPSWKRSIPPVREPRQATIRWLLFSDGGSLCTSLARQLEAQGDSVVTVFAGKQFVADDKGFVIRPGEGDDYQALLATLDERGQSPDRVLHLWNVSALGKKALNSTDEIMLHGFYSLSGLTQALGQRERDGALPVLVVASKTQQVASDEELYPARATLLGPCQVMVHAAPRVVCRSLDVETCKSRSRQEAELIERIIVEAEADVQDLHVAYRGRERWVRVYEPAPLPEPPQAARRAGLRPQGVYLFTGGLSGVGLTLARYLARAARARLVFITPFALPDPETWAQEKDNYDPQGPVSQRVQALQELRDLGAEVLVVRADVSDEAQMRAAVRAINQQVSVLHGVIHAAVSVGEGGNAAGVLGAQVRGALALEAALRGVPLDFMLLCSSQAALLGGEGQAASCAALAFLDAFAHVRQAQDDALTMSINWDERVGQAGEEVFQRIMARNRLPQIAVSTRHLPTLLEKAQRELFARDESAQEGALQAEHPRPNLPTAYNAPQGDVEEELTNMWQRLLGVNKVGRNDSFFRLGGHSLVAIQLVNRVRDTFNIDLSLRESFEAPTIAELAEYIRRAREAAQGVEPIAPAPRNGSLPLSLAQQRVWFLNSNGGGPSASSGRGPLGKLSATVRRVFERQSARHAPSPNVVATLRLNGALDRAALEQSLGEIARRHETLRTVFPVEDGQPVQVIAPAPSVALDVVDLRDLPEDEQQERLQQLAADEASYTFDLAQGPLWRTALLTVGADEHVLVLNAHRVVCDERSVEIFVQEMAQAYTAFSSGEPLALPELPIQYADFGAWQWGWLQEGALDAQLNYWRQQLGDSLPALKLPTDHVRADEAALRRAEQTFALEPELTLSLREMGQEHECTLFMALLAAFKALLHLRTGQNDIVVGTPVVNRNRSEVEELIGLFGNTLALRTDISGDPTFGELLSRVRAVTLGAYAHQDLPFETLVEGLESQALFQVMFVLENAPLPALDLPGLTVRVLKVDGIGSEFDLALFIEDTERGLEGRLEYDAALFEPETVADLVNGWQALLQAIVNDPGRRLSELNHGLH